MQELLTALQQLGAPLGELLVALFALLLPWVPLAAWIVFWTFAVNWVKLREILAQGAWIGLVLIGAVMVLVWGVIAPPAGGSFNLFGFQVSNFVEKTVYVSGLFCLMFLAGAVQLSGACGSWCQFNEPESVDDAHGHAGDPHGAHLGDHTSQVALHAPAGHH